MAAGSPQTLMVVVDASAVLAFYFDEGGAREVEAALPGALVSAVNLSEVIGKCLERGETLITAMAKLAAMGLEIVAHDAGLAMRTGELRPLTRRLGLSLADRACLALAERERACVLTADRAWSKIALGVDIRIIR
jgi:PIN domain nuclease of toxin-antitoxin system